MERTSHTPRLDRMPGDVLLRIFLRLEPDDIISLRLTCTWFGSVTKDITVWRHAYRRASYRHGIVFPIHGEDTANAEKLEQNTINYYRVSARLRKAHADPTLGMKELHPSSDSHCIRPVEIDQDGEEDSYVKYTSIAMVPGGRFAAATDSKLTLRLWDIARLDAGKTPSPSLIGQTEIPFQVAQGAEDEAPSNLITRLKCGAVKMEGIERVVILATIFTPRGNQGKHFVYYMDDPASTHSMLGLIGEYAFMPHLGGSIADWFYPESNYLIILGFNIVVWNYEQDMVATHPYLQGYNDYGHNVHQVALINSKLIVWLPTFNIRIYDLLTSSFYSRDGGPGGPHRDHPFYMAEIGVVEPTGIDDLITYTPPHYDRSEDILVSHLLGTREDDPLPRIIHFCKLTLGNLANGEFSENIHCEPADIGTFNDATSNLVQSRSTRRSSKLAAFHLPYQDQTFMWTDEEKKGLYFTVLSGSKASSILIINPSEGQEFSTYGRTGMVTAAFCPFSGRICYIDNSVQAYEECGHPCIRIVDFA